MSEEFSMVLCKGCHILFKRILDGKFNGKDKRWRDENGKLVNGKECNSCYVNRIKTLNKKKKEQIKI